MTQTTKVNGPEGFRFELKPGEVRTYECPDSGIVVKVFQIMGGGFTRVDVRAPSELQSGGVHLADFGGTWMYEATALNKAAEVVRWLQTDALERAAAS